MARCGGCATGGARPSDIRVIVLGETADDEQALDRADQPQHVADDERAEQLGESTTADAINLGRATDRAQDAEYTPKASSMYRAAQEGGGEEIEAFHLSVLVRSWFVPVRPGFVRDL